MPSLSIKNRLVIRVLLVTVASFVLSQSAAQFVHAQGIDPDSQNQIGLEGYCPVCVVLAKRWEKGDPEIQSTYDNVTYYFPSKIIKARFDESPAEFVPALGGDCTVCYEKYGKRVPGSLQHASLYNKRLYLFPSASEKRAFQRMPQAFVDTDLAANGECIVCLAKGDKHVPGSEQFTEFHNGFRYLFPSVKEQIEFRRSPANYAKFELATMPRDNQTSQRAGLVSSYALSLLDNPSQP